MEWECHFRMEWECTLSVWNGIFDRYFPEKDCCFTEQELFSGGDSGEVAGAEGGLEIVAAGVSVKVEDFSGEI